VKPIFFAFFLFFIIFFTSGCSAGNPERDIDIDMTILSPTMVSAQGFRITSSPEAHVGYTMRIQGSYFTFHWEEADMQLHYVVLDLTAGCCGQAFEFKYNGELPEMGTPIKITGVFSYYEIMGEVYFYISVTEWVEI